MYRYLPPSQSLKEQAVPDGFTVTVAAGDQTAKPLEEAATEGQLFPYEGHGG